MEKKLVHELQERVEELLVYEHLTSTTALLNVKLMVKNKKLNEQVANLKSQLQLCKGENNG